MQSDPQGRCCELERELARHVERAEASAQAMMAAERAVQVAQAQVADAAQKGSTEGAAALRRVSELETEVATLKASGNVMSRLFQLPTLPTKGDVLSGLGLEFTMDDRLRWKSGDVEGQQGSGGAGAEKTRPRLARDKAALQGGGGTKVRGLGVVCCIPSCPVCVPLSPNPSAREPPLNTRVPRCPLRRPRLARSACACGCSLATCSCST
jgi:type II secretory pathway pseudopilin PulG